MVNRPIEYGLALNGDLFLGNWRELRIKLLLWLNVKKKNINWLKDEIGISYIILDRFFLLWK